MGIDGIGKPPAPGGPASPAAAGSPTRVSPTGERFEVSRADAPGAAQGTDPLSRLERGEIGVDAYLDARVTEAVAHLEGQLASEQLELVKSTLREQLSSDPVLTELVRRATSGT